MQIHSTPLRYGLAVGLAFLALLFTMLLPLLPKEGIFLLPLAAIILAAWYGGWGPGMLATLVSGLAIDYLFIPPINSFVILPLENAVGLTVFTAVALLLIKFSEARRRDERALQDSQERWRAVFEHNPTMYFMVDPAGTILSVNPFGAEQLGYTVNELVGHSVLNVFYEADQEAVRQNVAICLEQFGRAMSWEFRKVRKNGTVIWVRETAKAVRTVKNEPVVLIVCEDITERKRAEEALQEKASLLDLTHDTIFVRDLKDVIRYWNRGAEELYGWTRAEAIGKVSHQLMETIFPAPLEEIMAELLRTGRWDGELVHRKRDGTQLVVASRWSLQRDEQGQPVAVLETNNDITARKRSEAMLRESEERYRNIFETAGVSIWEEDFSHVKAAIDDLIAHGVQDFRHYFAAHPEFVQQAIAMVKIVDVNDRTVKLFGAQSKQELLVSLHKIFLPETQEVFAEELIALAEGRISFETETVVQTLRGERLVVLFTITFPPPPCKFDRVLVSLTDITERKRAEEALRTMLAELAQVSRALTMRELTASIAHEVNQPLAAIVTNGNTCLRWLSSGEPDIKELRDAMTDIVNDANRASVVISRIREFLRKQPPQSVPVDMNDLIREVVALVNTDVSGKMIVLRTDLAPTLPIGVGDRVQLQQVLINLILNGVEAMSPVSERERELVIRSSPYGLDQVLVEVRDMGVGLDPDNIDRIFAPFFTTKPNGMGMGLSISRSIIDAHGGKLWATLNANRGTTFCFTLPTG